MVDVPADPAAPGGKGTPPPSCSGEFRSSTAETILGRLETLGIRLGLERTRDLLAALGDPQLSIPAVLVAGSNGKGSTAAMLAAMAGAAGYRTGLYTSPHLEVVEERLRLDGRAIASDRLGALLEGLVGVSERELGGAPTYFEALTVAALLWFAEQRVDLAVVEVGMGGRLDATNLCQPLLSLITPISLEHREHLGNTLGEIAREKAGILRRGRPALTWVEEPEAAMAIGESAAEIGADLHSARDEVELLAVEADSLCGQRIRLATPEAAHELELRLLGRHQAQNLGLAVRAAELLADRAFARLDRRAIAAGAAACRWPGRLEVIALPGGRRILLDAAHNPAGTGVLAAFLDRARPLTGTVDLLFGVLGDKDAGEMLELLVPRCRHVVLTRPPSARARPPEQLAAQLAAGRLGPGNVLIEPEPGAALARALDLGADSLVACGSIFLVGELRRLLRQRYAVPPPAADLAG
ncbi:MAG TPA: folylpolyglutamate synthase/dihydrofolate synthase family protein [Thermoanaerobaculia bacterium]|nr:folylpolyglutamate synthase/dihydrofolate synthase family protein [Thermoanaerobaculia bacterium]